MTDRQPRNARLDNKPYPGPGEVVEVPDEVGRAFLVLKHAERVDAASPEPEPETADNRQKATQDARETRG
jgi:hypothetical protein